MQDGSSPSSTDRETPWEFPEGYFGRDEAPEDFIDSGESDLPSSRIRGGRGRGSRSQRTQPAQDGEAPAKPLSPEKLERRAKNIVLHQLSRQAKSAQQLREVLEKREIPSEIAEAVIERFTEAGLINDLQFAITVAHSRRQTRGLSTSAIRRELMKKGVGQNEIDEALRDFAAEDELETAVRIAVKRLRAMTKLEPEVRRRRLLGFLARKGYPGSIAYRALKLAEAQAEE
jgi:regulatory protein